MNDVQEAHPLPRHIAIAMDGNGRWAQERGLPRSEGHRQGSKATYNTILDLSDRGLDTLSLFVFSVENFQRDAREVNFLLEELIPATLSTFIPTMLERGIRFRLIGEYNSLPEKLMRVAHSAMKQTADGYGMRLNLAIGYSGRREILHALRQTVEAVGLEGLNQVDEATFARHLYTGDLPDPDLYIRCGCHNRISNFMLWQMAYTELYPVNVLWPDFTATHLDAALSHYHQQSRTFGRVIK